MIVCPAALVVVMKTTPPATKLAEALESRDVLRAANPPEVEEPGAGVVVAGDDEATAVVRTDEGVTCVDEAMATGAGEDVVAGASEEVICEAGVVATTMGEVVVVVGATTTTLEDETTIGEDVEATTTTDEVVGEVTTTGGAVVAVVVGASDVVGWTAVVWVVEAIVVVLRTTGVEVATVGVCEDWLT